MERLSDDKLVEAYILAKKMNVDPLFIKQLESELQRRSIDINDIKPRE